MEIFMPYYGPVHEKDLHRARIDIDYNSGVKCPICGCDYVHVSSVAQNTQASSGDQGNVVITFTGECGHRFAYIFDGHKGIVSTAAVDLSMTGI